MLTIGRLLSRVPPFSAILGRRRWSPDRGRIRLLLWIACIVAATKLSGIQLSPAVSQILTIDDLSQGSYFSATRSSSVFGLIRTEGDEVGDSFRRFVVEIDSESETVFRAVEYADEDVFGNEIFEENSMRLYCVGKDLVKIFDLENFEWVPFLPELPSWWIKRPATFPYHLAVSSTGRLAVTDEEHGTLLFDLSTGALLAESEVGFGSVAFSPNGDLLYGAFADREIAGYERVYRSDVSEDLLRFEGPWITRIGGDGRTWFDFSPDGKWVGLDGLWIDQEFNTISEVSGAFSVSFSPDMKWAFCGDSIRELTGAKRVYELPPDTAAYVYNPISNKLFCNRTLYRGDYREEWEVIHFYDFERPTELEAPELTGWMKNYIDYETDPYLHWENRSFRTRFTLEYRVNETGDWESFESGIPYLDNRLRLYTFDTERSTTYEFRVRAEYEDLVSPWSNIVKIRVPSLSESWRIKLFGTAENAGLAADNAMDRFGVSNLERYAFDTSIDYPDEPILQPRDEIAGYPRIHFDEASSTWLVKFAKRREISAPGIQYFVETSVDCETWMEVTEPQKIVSGKIWESITFALPEAVKNTGEPRWFRVRVGRTE